MGKDITKVLIVEDDPDFAESLMIALGMISLSWISNFRARMVLRALPRFVISAPLPKLS